MNKDYSRSHKNLYGNKFVEEVNDNNLTINYSTLKNYEFIKGLDLISIDDYVEESVNPNLYLYDFEKMIKKYHADTGRKIPYQNFRDRKHLGKICIVKGYPRKQLDRVLNHFAEMAPIYKEYVTIKDFVNAIKGDEPLSVVRIRWYKRLLNVGVERKRKGKMVADLSKYQLRKIPDVLNSTSKTEAFFYNLEDLLKIKALYDSRNKAA